MTGPLKIQFSSHNTPTQTGFVSKYDARRKLNITLRLCEDNINIAWYLETLLPFTTTEQSPNLSKSFTFTHKHTYTVHTHITLYELYYLMSNNLLAGAESTQSVRRSKANHAQI